MAVERAAGGTSLIDVLDRVLDKGIVIDAWVRVSLVGIDLITVEARVVVASIDTYLKYSEAVGAASVGGAPGHRGAAAVRRARRRERRAAGAARRQRHGASPRDARAGATPDAAIARPASHARGCVIAAIGTAPGAAQDRRPASRGRGAARECASVQGGVPRTPLRPSIARRGSSCSSTTSCTTRISPAARRPASNGWPATPACGARSAWRSTARRACSSALPATASPSEDVELFSWPLSDTHDPLVRALLSGRADCRSAPAAATATRRARPATPLGTGPFTGDPAARAARRRCRTRSACCCCAPATAITPDVNWLATVLGQKIEQIRGRGSLARGSAQAAPRARAVLHHHQLRHRPDPADRHRRAADRRQRARREAVCRDARKRARAGGARSS